MRARNKQSARVAVIVRAAAVLYAGGALAQTTIWTASPATPADWFTAGNWSGGVPTSSSYASINNAGTAIIGVGAAAVNTLYLGSGSAGTVNQTAGQLTSTFLYLGYTGAAGSYQLSGGSLTASSQIYVGYNSSGTFTQSGGIVIDSSSAILVGSQGLYQLSGGTVTATSLSLTSGGGAFAQSGGTATFKSLTMSSGAKVSLQAGALNIQDLTNTGSFDFSGGAGTLSYTGIADFSIGTVVNPSQAQLVGGPTSLLLLPNGANPSTYFGSVNTQGLVHVVGSALNIPAGTIVRGTGTIVDHVNVSGSISGASLTSGINVSGSASAYATTLNVNDNISGISGGTLLAQVEYIGSSSTAATFTQSGGIHTASSLVIASGSHYALGGGTLRTTWGLDNEGTIDFSGGNLMANGIVNLARGSMTNPSQVAVTVTPNSLLILPMNFQPDTQFKSFTNSGLVHNVGSPLVIPAGSLITGIGEIDDPITCYGRLSSASITPALNLNNGVNVPAGGFLSIIGCTATVNDQTSSVTGGTLWAGTMNIGVSQPASFSISSGDADISTFKVGCGADATLNISGGTASGSTLVGYSSNGSVTQAGGTNWGGPEVGYGAGVTGTYHLIAGTVTAGTTTVGYYGNGTFTQDGGINSTWITLGQNSGSTGLYQMNGGTMSGIVIQVGIGGTGSIVQTGGTVGNPLSFTQLQIGASFGSGASGSYTLKSGTVTLASSDIGDNSPGTLTQSGGSWSSSSEYVGLAAPGSVTQSAGSHSVASSTLYIGYLGSGTYNLSGGTLTALSETIGQAAKGVLAQSGGVHTIFGALTLSNQGELDFAGGTLTANSLKMSAGSLLDLQLDPINPFSPIDIAGFATFAGTLKIDLLGSALPDPSQSFIALISTLPSGAFSNIPSGSRLMTSDGRGSFLVTYGTRDPLTLSDFVAVPEPSSAMLVFLAIPLLARRRRHLSLQ